MKREELLKSKEYWTTKIQLDLFEMIHEYLKSNKINRTQLAEKLGVSKGYVSQILNGNFDHKVSKLVELALALDKIPNFEFKDVNRFIHEDKYDIQQERLFTEIVYIRIRDDHAKEHVMTNNEITQQYRFSDPQGYLIN